MDTCSPASSQVPLNDEDKGPDRPGTKGEKLWDRKWEQPIHVPCCTPERPGARGSRGRQRARLNRRPMNKDEGLLLPRCPLSCVTLVGDWKGKAAESPGHLAVKSIRSPACCPHMRKRPQEMDKRNRAEKEAEQGTKEKSNNFFLLRLIHVSTKMSLHLRDLSWPRSQIVSFITQPYSRQCEQRTEERQLLR